jgi:hypothetical protein
VPSARGFVGAGISLPTFVGATAPLRSDNGALTMPYPTGVANGDIVFLIANSTYNPFSGAPGFSAVINGDYVYSGAGNDYFSLLWKVRSNDNAININNGGYPLLAFTFAYSNIFGGSFSFNTAWSPAPAMVYAPAVSANQAPAAIVVNVYAGESDFGGPAIYPEAGFITRADQFSAINYVGLSNRFAVTDKSLPVSASTAGDGHMQCAAQTYAGGFAATLTMSSQVAITGSSGGATGATGGTGGGSG